jgi:hypothetical protein
MKNVKAVDIFRGVSFNDWLRVFMQVCRVSLDLGSLLDVCLFGSIVPCLPNEGNTTSQTRFCDTSSFPTRVRQDSIRLALISNPHRILSHPLLLTSFPVYSLRHRNTVFPRRRRTRTEANHRTPVQQRASAFSLLHYPVGSVPQMRLSLLRCRNICLGR